MITIVVVDDHALVRQSLVKMLDAEEEFEVIGQAGSADEATALISTHDPDIVLMDIAMPGKDGLEAAGRLSDLAPDTDVVFLTMHDDDASLRQAMALHARGFVPKTAPVDEVAQAVRTVAGGGTYLSPSVARRVMDLASGRGAGPVTQLTDRELEILRLLAAGNRPADMADELYLSVKTIKNHLTNVYAKLGVETAAQAVAEAYRLGIAHGSTAEGGGSP